MILKGALGTLFFLLALFVGYNRGYKRGYAEKMLSGGRR